MGSEVLERDGPAGAETVMATAPEDPDAPGADLQDGAFAVLERGAGRPPADED